MKTMMMPASYNVMSNEEMTYTAGGATTLEAVCAVLVPGYANFRLISDARAERQKNPNGWLTTVINDRIADAQQNTTNAVYQVATAVWTGLGCLSVIGLVSDLVMIYV